MISPVDKKYYDPKRDKIVKVTGYEDIGLGTKVIKYINIKTREYGRLPINVFRKRYIRYNNYTQQKQKLEI